jgi:hypothetical protein
METMSQILKYARRKAWHSPPSLQEPPNFQLLQPASILKAQTFDRSLFRDRAEATRALLQTRRRSKMSASTS